MIKRNKQNEKLYIYKSVAHKQIEMDITSALDKKLDEGMTTRRRMVLDLCAIQIFLYCMCVFVAL